MSLIASYKPISSLVKLIQPALSISIHWVPRPNRFRSIPILLTTLYRGQHPEVRLSKLRCSLVLDLTDDGEIDCRHGTLMGLSLLLINHTPQPILIQIHTSPSRKHFLISKLCF